MQPVTRTQERHSDGSRTRNGRPQAYHLSNGWVHEVLPKLSEDEADPKLGVAAEPLLQPEVVAAAADLKEQFTRQRTRIYMSIY